MRKLVLMLALASAAWGQCGKIVPNPTTGKLDCGGNNVTGTFNSRGVWSGATTYAALDLVSFSNVVYVSLQGTNLNHQPDSAPTFWALTGLQGPAGSGGANGSSAFVYVAYASDAAGTGFTTTFNSALDYIAIKATTSQISSPQASDFSGLWKNYRGATGGTGATGPTGSAGSAGQSAYVYIAYASDSSGTGFTSTFNPSLQYIAIKTTTTVIASPQASDFTGLWTPYIGGGGAGNIVGPNSSTAGHVPSFSDTTGHTLADTYAVGTTVTAPGDNSTLPTTASIVNYVSTLGGGDVSASGTFNSGQPIFGSGASSKTIVAGSRSGNTTAVVTLASGDAKTSAAPLTFDASGNAATASTPIAGTYGGTNNAFMQFAGPATSPKTFTLPNSNSTLAALGSAQAWTNTQTFTDGNFLLGGLTSGTYVLKGQATASGTGTFPNVTGTVLVAPTSATATNALFATTTAGAPGYRPIALGDLPTQTGSGSIVLGTSPIISAPTITGHPVVEGVTSTGATGTGNFVFSASPTITGNPTIEGVTATGATGTGNFVFSAAPTLTGHPTIEGITSTGATGTGAFVFGTSPTITTPTISGHPTVEGITSTGATGTGLLVFGTSPTLTTPIIGSFVSAAHNHTNAVGGGQLAEGALLLSDVTTTNASTTAHGFLPKLTGNASQFFNGIGTFTVPAGGGNISGGTISTTNAVPKVNGSNVITESGVLVDSSNNIAVPGAVTTGVGSGSAGVIDFSQGTAPAAQGSNTVRFRAPTSVPTAFSWTLPSADAAGALTSNGSGTLSMLGTNGSGNLLRSVGTANIATGKTLTANNSMTLAGLDGAVLSLAANLTTSGLFNTTLTTTGTTTVTLPTSGTLMPNPMSGTGDLTYGGASGAATRLAASSVASQPLLSGALAAPTWATIGYPTSATSGGLPYFSSTTTMASSAALAANGVVIGGGAGQPPTTAAGCTYDGANGVTCTGTMTADKFVSSYTGTTEQVFKEGTIPANPNAGSLTMWVNSATHIAALLNSSGVSTAFLMASSLDTDGTLVANSDSKIATQKATKTYVDSHSGGSVAGCTSDGASGLVCTGTVTGDKFVSSYTGTTEQVFKEGTIPSSPSAGTLTMWVNSATHIAELLNSAGASTAFLMASVLDTDGTLAANSDTKVATQKATKTYVDAHSGGGGSMVYPGAGIPNSTGSAWGTSYSLVTTVGGTGTNTNIPSEAAVRSAIIPQPGGGNGNDGGFLRCTHGACNDGTTAFFVPTGSNNANKLVTTTATGAGSVLIPEYDADGNLPGKYTLVTTVGGTGSDLSIPSEKSVRTAIGAISYQTVQDEASNLTQRPKINFVGAGVTCADSSANSRTDCTIPADVTTSGVQTLSGKTLSSASLGTTPLTTTYTNEGTTGTTTNLLVKLTTANPSTAIKAATTDTSGLIGICVSGCGTTSTSEVATRGQATCVADASVTAGHYVTVGTSTAGRCGDSGAATYPTSGQILGRWLANGTVGNGVALQLFGPEVQAVTLAANTTATGSQFFTAYNSTTGAFTKAPIAAADLPAALANSTSINGVAVTSGKTLVYTDTSVLAAQMPALTGDVTTSAGAVATTIAAGAVSPSKSSTAMVTRTCSVVVGADNGSALADADIGPQGRQCLIPQAATITEVTVAADAGTPSVQVRKNHAGTQTNLMSGALATASAGAVACAATGAACLDGTTKSGSITITTASSTNVLAAGDWLEITSGTAGGTAKRMSIAITYTLN